MENRLPFVLVAKPDSHQHLFEWVEMVEQAGGGEHGQWPEGPACPRRYFQYRIVRQVPLSAALCTWVTFVEVWETDQTGKVVYHNSWVTDLDVDRDNVAVIMQIGRCKWKIENEQFNVPKNHGYELEHNYGHGRQTLSMVFYLLNRLAFVAHTILDLGDRLYQQCRARGVAARTLECVANHHERDPGPELAAPAAALSGRRPAQSLTQSRPGRGTPAANG